MRRVIDDNLAAVTAKNLEMAVSAFAPDGVLIDPHYPDPRMAGQEAIARGLAWVFTSMRELHFRVDRYLAGDGPNAAVEVTSDHVLRTGGKVHLQQMFVVDVDPDGLITRWRAYGPYGPHGIAGLARRLSAVGHRLRR